MLGVFFLVLFVGISVLLVLIVLVQDDESGEGLGSIWGGGASSRNSGRRSGNVVTRITAILGTLFMLSAFGLAWLHRAPTVESIEKTVRENLKKESVEWWLSDQPEKQTENPDSLQKESQ